MLIVLNKNIIVFKNQKKKNNSNKLSKSPALSELDFCKKIL